MFLAPQGLVPAGIRLIPHTVLTFIFLEQLRLYFGIRVVTSTWTLTHRLLVLTSVSGDPFTSRQHKIQVLMGSKTFCDQITETTYGGQKNMWTLCCCSVNLFGHPIHLTVIHCAKTMVFQSFVALKENNWFEIHRKVHMCTCTSIFLVVNQHGDHMWLNQPRWMFLPGVNRTKMPLTTTAS